MVNILKALILIISLCLAGCFLPRPTSASAPAAVLAARPFVYSLLVDGHFRCTAFAVRSERGNFAMSAGHCSKRMNAGDEADLFSSLTRKTYRVRLQVSTLNWPTADFGIWHYVGAAPTSGVEITSRVPGLGEDVWTFGSPLGMTTLLTGGTYAGIHDCVDKDDEICTLSGLHAITAFATYGSSGSPVLDSTGKVWGILVGGPPSLQGVSSVVLMPEFQKWVW